MDTTDKSDNNSQHNKKKIVFLTGTRADFGKLKSLIEITYTSRLFDVHIFVTGMHMNPRYGGTHVEIQKAGFKDIMYKFANHKDNDLMETILANTILGFSDYIQKLKPDFIIVHGDRVEALAGAIVGALNNILVGHIEGGEVSGTVDELIRHAVSKMSHVHFVSNDTAKNRLIQMGELEESIFVIGSPDIDIMFSDKLPDIINVKKHYEIGFEKFAMLLFHPVTTEYNSMKKQAINLVDAIIESKTNFIVIYPNNDLGCDFIFEQYKRLENQPHIRMFPSIRFECFLVLLKNAQFIIGNSSVGIREAIYYGIPTINVGSRQTGRTNNEDIIQCAANKRDILNAIKEAMVKKIKPHFEFGNGKSAEKFFTILQSKEIWKINKQKRFNDIL